MRPYRFQRAHIKRLLAISPRTIYAEPSTTPTPRMMAAYRIIQARINACGMAPTRRELAALMEYKSVSTADQVVQGLIERGYIAIMPGRARAMTLLVNIS